MSFYNPAHERRHTTRILNCQSGQRKSEQNATMKAWFLLLLLLPVCFADYKIQCYGEDFLMVNHQVLTCTSKVLQACYTRSSGEKGCARLEFCQRPGWKCCHTNLCNA
ncbi:hypothetical protein SRHO_G00041540 [Serrasalmus rhombeus]